MGTRDTDLGQLSGVGNALAALRCFDTVAVSKLLLSLCFVRDTFNLYIALF